MRILDATDNLVETGGRSIDRHRHRKKIRPQRKAYRPIRNRAIIYLLLETGMRRAAVVSLNVHDIDEARRVVSVIEKGAIQHTYHLKRGFRSLV